MNGNGMSTEIVTTGPARPNHLKAKPDLVDAALRRLGKHIKGTISDRCARLQEAFEEDAALGEGHEIADCSECGYASSETLPGCAFCGHDAPVKGADGKAIEAAEPVDLAKDPDAAERKLDSALLRYRAAGREMVGAGWDMGNAVREIHEHRLYLARRDAKQQPVHRNFADFCTKELGKSSVHVLRMIDVARAYSRDEAVRIGESKLGILMRVTDPEARAKLAPLAEESTHKQLAGKVREAIDRGEAGERPETDRKGRKLPRHMKQRPPEVELPHDREPEYPPPVVMGQKPAAPAAPSAAKPGESWIKPADAPPPARRLTLSAEEGSHQVPFWAKRKGAFDKKRAKTLADAPKGRLRMLNGTELVFTLHQGERGLYMNVQVREVADERPGGKKARKGKAKS